MRFNVSSASNFNLLMILELVFRPDHFMTVPVHWEFNLKTMIVIICARGVSNSVFYAQSAGYTRAKYVT